MRSAGAPIHVLRCQMARSLLPGALRHPLQLPSATRYAASQYPCPRSTRLQKVSGALATLLEDDGGAVQVVAGGTFCAALTAAGRVVLWGKVPGGTEGPAEELGGPATEAAEADGGGRVLGLTDGGVDIVQGGLGRIVEGQRILGWWLRACLACRRGTTCVPVCQRTLPSIRILSRRQYGL